MDQRSNNTKKNSKNLIKYEQEELQFGGPIGVFFIMIFSHLILIYFWLCLEFNKGFMIFPQSKKDLLFYLEALKLGLPTLKSILIYFIFILFSGIIAVTIPGPIVKGLPIPSENGRQLDYLCNATTCWYITLLSVLALHYFQIFKLSEVVDNYAPLMFTSIIFGDLLSLFVYFEGIQKKTAVRMTGNFFYDFFMGSQLNPRIGKIFDFKIWSELRISWILLFLLTLSAGIKQYEENGYITSPLWFMIIAHFLYANACQKGEECVTTTWDIFHEKWGWMLIFWNVSGVPFLYSFQSFFILKNGPFELPLMNTILLFIVLLIAYYVWDTANSQKNLFRMKERGTYIKRYTFPQLPWNYIENPKYLSTDAGSKLLIDGWYRYAKKIHYTADITMALCWGLACGVSAFLPYYYFCFFTTFLCHRCVRDHQRCQNKYGKDWEKYCSIVKYTLIPGII